MQVSLGPITIHFAKNGKYVKKEDCNNLHLVFNKHLDQKLDTLTLDRNQKLLELKTDLLTHIDIKFELMKK